MAGQEPKHAEHADAAEEIAGEGEEEDLESYDEGEEEIVFDPMQELSAVLEPFLNTMEGIREALDKQNKILYKLASVVENK